MPPQGDGSTKPSKPAAPTTAGWLATEPARPSRHEREGSEERLDQHSRQAGYGVEQAEEAHQLRTLSEITDRLGLEKIVSQRREHRRRGDDESQVP